MKMAETVVATGNLKAGQEENYFDNEAKGILIHNDSLFIHEDIIRHLSLFLDRSSILNLMCVNSCFKSVFRKDQYFRQFLYYPLKYFLCDLNSESIVSNVSQCLNRIKEIDSNNKSKRYPEYFKLQNAHLQNWVDGLSNNYDEVFQSPQEFSYMEEMVDNNNKHWLFFSVASSLHIWNITAKPQRHSVVRVGDHSCLRVLPQGIILIKDIYSCLISVYQFKMTLNYALTFQYSFVYYVNNLIYPSMNPKLESRLNFRFILLEDYFIGYDCQFLRIQECVLYLWKITPESAESDFIRLFEYDVIKAFLEFVTVKTEGKDNFTQSCYGCVLDLRPGNYPQIVVALKRRNSLPLLSQVNVFNIEIKQFTHLVSQCESEILDCCIYFSKISMLESYRSQGSTIFEVSVYVCEDNPVQWVPVGGVDSSGNPLMTPVHGEKANFLWQCEVARNSDTLDFDIVFKRSKIFIKKDDQMTVVNLDCKSKEDFSFSVSRSYKILGFIEPKLLLMYDAERCPTSTGVEVYNIISRRKLFHWENVNTEKGRFWHYFKNLEYPSKIILNVENEHKLRVYNF